MARLTAKGQVTIPKQVRERLGLAPGDEIEFILEGEAIVVRKKLVGSPFLPYRGYLRELTGRDPDELVAGMRGH
jgi:AbrB family looped-hinge helix DNA binding protein